MKRVLPILSVLLGILMFCACSLLGGNVKGNTYVCTDVDAKVTGMGEYNDQLLSRLEGSKGTKMTFNEDGSITTTFGYLLGKSWRQEGSDILINGGIQTLKVKSGKVVITVGSDAGDFKAVFTFTRE